jgi:hypothetical protein
VAQTGLHVGEAEGAGEDVGEVPASRNSAMAAAYWRAPP